jgi:hypothetical protein
MSADDERKAGAVALAHALSWGSGAEALRADAKAIALDVPHILLRWIRRIDRNGDRFVYELTPDHLAGAAQFFRELAAALDEQAAKMRG